MKVVINKDVDISLLKKDKVYIIVSIDYIMISPSENTFKINYRILDENNTLGLYSEKYFQLVDGVIEKDYIVVKRKISGNFEMVPASLSYDTFWEDFYDYEENAMRKFRKRFPALYDILF